MKEFQVDDFVRGVDADIEGCEGIITKIDPSSHGLPLIHIQLTKVGSHSWHGRSDKWKVGKTVSAGWGDVIELIDRPIEIGRTVRIDNGFNNIGETGVISAKTLRDDGYRYTIRWNKQQETEGFSTDEIKTRYTILPSVPQSASPEQINAIYRWLNGK